MEALGGRKVEIDFGIFRAAGDLLQAGPWVAERYAAIRSLCRSACGRHEFRGARHHRRRASLHGGGRFAAEYELRELRRAAEAQWERMDVLLLPTTGTIYTHEAMAAERCNSNSDLGYYTNFVNLLDLAAVAVPAGVRTNGLPFGVSLIGPAFSEEALLCLAIASTARKRWCPATFWIWRLARPAVSRSPWWARTCAGSR